MGTVGSDSVLSSETKCHTRYPRKTSVLIDKFHVFEPLSPARLLCIVLHVEQEHCFGLLSQCDHNYLLEWKRAATQEKRELLRTLASACNTKNPSLPPPHPHGRVRRQPGDTVCKRT